MEHAARFIEAEAGLRGRRPQLVAAVDKYVDPNPIRTLSNLWRG
jgi:hypothetical protein